MGGGRGGRGKWEWRKGGAGEMGVAEWRTEGRNIYLKSTDLIHPHRADIEVSLYISPFSDPNE